jgi:hypothetical protein
MKASFTTNSIGQVTLSYDSEDMTGDTVRITREFSCPPDGGYVIEFVKGGNTKQVCDRLGHMGSTLMCSSREGLLALIRREYKAMRAAEKREAARF